MNKVAAIIVFAVVLIASVVTGKANELFEALSKDILEEEIA